MLVFRLLSCNFLVLFLADKMHLLQEKVQATFFLSRVFSIKMSDEYDTVKDQVQDLLNKSGALPSIKAQLRKSVFECLNNSKPVFIQPKTEQGNDKIY